MSLSEESRTILKLVLARGKSYAEIAALLGIDSAGVEERARLAIAELNSPSDPPLEPAVTDYLLGQIDPLDAAGVERRIAENPALADQVDLIQDQLQLVAPTGRRRAPQTARRERRSASSSQTRGSSTRRAPKSSRPSRSRTTGGLTAAQRRLVAVLLGAALLAGILILVLTGVIGGSSDGDDASSDPPATSASLRAVSGQSGQGSAQIGFNGEGSLAVNLQATDLAPSSGGQVYALWFDGPKGAFPVDQVQVGQEGSIARQIPLIGPEICLVADGVFQDFRLTRVDRAKLKADVQKRRKTKNANNLPGAIGRSVLAGEISMPQDARDKIIRQCSSTAG